MNHPIDLCHNSSHPTWYWGHFWRKWCIKAIAKKKHSLWETSWSHQYDRGFCGKIEKSILVIFRRELYPWKRPWRYSCIYIYWFNYNSCHFVLQIEDENSWLRSMMHREKQTIHVFPSLFLVIKTNWT